MTVPMPVKAVEVLGGRNARQLPLAGRTSLLYLATYLHYGFGAFLPLGLTKRGASPAEIGTIMAIPMFLRLLTLAPFAAWIGKLGRVRDAVA